MKHYTGNGSLARKFSPGVVNAKIPVLQWVLFSHHITGTINAFSSALLPCSTSSGTGVVLGTPRVQQPANIEDVRLDCIQQPWKTSSRRGSEVQVLSIGLLGSILQFTPRLLLVGILRREERKCSLLQDKMGFPVWIDLELTTR